MVGYGVYALRACFRLLRNLRGYLHKAPDYVVFTLEGPYPAFPPPRGGFLQRRLLPRLLSLADLRQQFRVVAANRRVHGVVLHLRRLRKKPSPSTP